MEEILWRIDANPTEAGKLEDGEISESDTESPARKASRMRRSAVAPDSTALSTISPNGTADPSSIQSNGSGSPSTYSPPSAHSPSSAHSPPSTHSTLNGNDLTYPANDLYPANPIMPYQPNPNKPAKKKPFKKKTNTFNYASLSEEELQTQLRLVHKQLQYMESNPPPPMDPNSPPSSLPPAIPPVNLLSNTTADLLSSLPTNLLASNPPPAIPPPNFSLSGNQSSPFPSFGQQQANQQFPKSQPNQSNNSQPFVFQQPIGRPPQANPKAAKKFRPPNQQVNFNFGDNNMNLHELKKLFNQLKKVIIQNSRPKPNYPNAFNKFKNNQRRFPDDPNADAPDSLPNVNPNHPSGTLPNQFICGYKRKMIDKNNNPMKRPNKKHPAFASTYNQTGAGPNGFQPNANQPAFTGAFSPVITSDLFGAPNQFKHNNPNFNKNRRRHANQVCKYFLLGSCHKGDHCEFRHTKDKNAKINELCKFYVQNACDKGSNCPYLHKEFPCKYFHTNTTCHEGINCRFSHEPLTDEMRKVLKQHLNPKEKTELVKKEKVLLGDPTSTMKSSLETWKWQQEIRKLEAEQADEEEKNAFKIANEFIIREEPDLKFKKNVYSEGFLRLTKIKNESDADGEHEESASPFFDVKNENDSDLRIAEDEQQPSLPNELQSTPANDLTQQSAPVNEQQTDAQRSNLYQRRSDLLKNKENESHQSSESPYLKKLEQIISGNKMSQMHKQEVAGQQAPNNAGDGLRSFSHAGSSATNASLYKCKESDNMVLNSLSGLINKLADETKIGSVNEENTALQFEAFRRSVEKKPVEAKVERSLPVEPMIVQEETEPTVTRARSLIDEIMSSEGYVASPSISLANLSKPTGQLNQQINPPPVPRFLVDSSLNGTQTASPNGIGLLGSICSSDLSEFSGLQTAKESDLFNLTNQHLNSPFAQHVDLPLPVDPANVPPPNIREPPQLNVDAFGQEYIVSESDDGATQFKLYLLDKTEGVHYEQEPYLYSSMAETDPRTQKIANFVPSSPGYPEPLFQLRNAAANLELLCELSGKREKMPVQ